MKREAALIYAAIAAALALAVGYGIVTAEQADLWKAALVAALPVIALVQGMLTRRDVFSQGTLEDAGLDPEQVVRDAEATRAGAP